MNKAIIGLAIAAATMLSSSAFAWVCTAQATDGTGRAWTFEAIDKPSAARLALQYCGMYSPPGYPCWLTCNP